MIRATELCQLIDRLIDGLIDRLIDRLIDGLNEGLNDGLNTLGRSLIYTPSGLCVSCCRFAFFLTFKAPRAVPSGIEFANFFFFDF